MNQRLKRMLLAVVMLIVVASGCTAVMEPLEPVTISFVHPEDPTGAYTQWAEQFHEEYPHITVELISTSDIPGSQIVTNDAFVATQFELAGYQQDGAIIDLSPFMAETDELDVDDFYPSALEVFSSEGRQWALPFGIDTMMVYYNQDLFDQYGVSYPQIGWNWGDFLAYAIAMTDERAGLYGYALHYTEDFGVYEPIMIIYQAGGQIFDSLQEPTRVTFDEPRNIEAMEFYANLIYDLHVVPTPEEAARLGRAYPWRGVLEERFAMWSTLFSERGGRRWPVEWEMRWGAVPMPRDERAASLGLAEGLFVSSASEEPAAAWTWIHFLSQQVPPFTIPARQSLAASQEFERLAGAQTAAAARAALSDTILVNPELLGFETAIFALAEAFEQIRSGEVTPEIALTGAQERAER